MPLTLQNIRDHARSILDLDTTDLPDAMMDLWIREATFRVERYKHRWPFYESTWSFATASAVKDYAFTAIGTGDLREPVRLSGPNFELTYIGADEGDQGFLRNQTATGDPVYWRVWGSTIRLYPTPGGVATINVRGYRNPIDWVAVGAGGQPDMPDDLHQCIVQWTLHRAYLQQEDVEMASMYSQMFSTTLDAFASNLTDAPGAQPLVLGGGTYPRRYDNAVPLGPGRWPFN